MHLRLSYRESILDEFEYISRNASYVPKPKFQSHQNVMNCSSFDRAHRAENFDTNISKISKLQLRLSFEKRQYTCVHV